MHEVNQYVRFQKNPPEKKPPPKGQVDLYFDPTTGKLVSQSDAGTETPIGGAADEFSTTKATLADGDKFGLLDSEASDAPKHSLWSLVKSTLKTYFDTLYAAPSGTIIFDDTITGLTGGGDTNLDGIATAGVSVGQMRAVTVNAGADENYYIYKLTSSTAAENSPIKIRPDDYASGTNQKVWTLVSFRGDIVGGTTLTIQSQTDGSHAAILAPTGLTSFRTFTFPDASGKIAAVTSYADETTANAAEAANVVYYNEATGKFQITTA